MSATSGDRTALQSIRLCPHHNLNLRIGKYKVSIGAGTLIIWRRNLIESLVPKSLCRSSNQEGGKKPSSSRPKPNSTPTEQLDDFAVTDRVNRSIQDDQRQYDPCDSIGIFDTNRQAVPAVFHRNPTPQHHDHAMD